MGGDGRVGSLAVRGRDVAERGASFPSMSSGFFLVTAEAGLARRMDRHEAFEKLLPVLRNRLGNWDPAMPITRCLTRQKCDS